jgi:hypothetical protein
METTVTAYIFWGAFEEGARRNMWGEDGNDVRLFKLNAE